MTKNEFLSTLASELNRRAIEDTDEIVSEYEQHFRFKMADGYPEEEIAAKLGDPVLIATQFDPDDSQPVRGRAKWMAKGVFVIAAVPVALLFLMLMVTAIALIAFVLSFTALAVALFADINVYSLIPPMPYWNGAVFGVAAAALTLLLAVGCVYYLAFIRQLARAYRRFRSNVIASVTGTAPLPPLTIYPQLTGKTNRRLRLLALLSFALFAISLLLGIIVAVLSTGTIEFWHAWNWFAGVQPSQ